jgi:hypothetical protein
MTVPLYIVLLALGLIVTLLAIFTFITYWLLRLSAWARPKRRR